jgi:hypothetical protein
MLQCLIKLPSPYCTWTSISRNVLTAWKTNAYTEEEQPSQNDWLRRPLVRRAALCFCSYWVHGAGLHLLLLEYIGVRLFLQLPASGPICCWSSDKRPPFLAVFLHHSQPNLLSQLTQRRAQHLPWSSPPVSSFPHQSPVGKVEAVSLFTPPSPQIGRATAAVTITTGFH